MSDKKTSTLYEAEPLTAFAYLNTRNRREFLGLAFTAASGALLWPVIGRAQSSDSCPAVVSPDLMKVGEITSKGGVLKGVIDVVAERRSITYYDSPIYKCDFHILRAYHGYQGWSLDPKNRVTQVGVASPGPTLRLAIGESIELMFLNRIDMSMFPLTSVTSVYGKCDTTKSLSGNGQRGPGTPPYPGDDAKYFPDCFHASNTTNMHYHGTHTEPGGFGDNVLIGVLPDPKLNVTAIMKVMTDAYNEWAKKENPTKALIATASTMLDKMYEAAKQQKNEYMIASIESAIHSNHEAKAAGEFPQYWPGFFPYHFELPKFGVDNVTMGQAPGTHWYHCHQHGSTSLQILNGMAGLIVATGDYDDKILSLGGGTPDKPKIKEHVMIWQLFSEQPNQVNTNQSAAIVSCNSQMVPTIKMAKGEVQWWRIADAMMKAHGIERFLFVSEKVFNSGGPWTNGKPPVSAKGSTPVLYQTAQDGVQYAWENYQRRSKLATFNVAPGNRVDFLVQGMATEGTAYLVFWPPAGTPAIADIRSLAILKVVVAGEPGDANTQLPTQAQYPVQPSFLADITDTEINGRARTVTFSMTTAGPDGPPAGPGSQPHVFIDGKRFNEGVIDQVMLLGTAEEWTLVNKTLFSIQHPFHIHINPFQITEVYNPATMGSPYKLQQPWPWGDVVPIPAGIQQTDENGNPVVDAKGNPVIVPGTVKIRSRFVDFFGKYVLHCHILGHEDRGMMQMVEVVNNKTIVKHGH